MGQVGGMGVGMGMGVGAMTRATLQYQGYRLIAAYLDDQGALFAWRTSSSRGSHGSGTTQLLGALGRPVGEDQGTLFTVGQRQDQGEQQERLRRGKREQCQSPLN